MRQKKHIVVIGWDVDQTVEGLLKGLGDFAPADSSVTIISPKKPDGIPEESGSCSFQHLEGSIASRQVLVEVNSARAHVIGGGKYCLLLSKLSLCRYSSLVWFRVLRFRA